MARGEEQGGGVRMPNRENLSPRRNQKFRACLSPTKKQQKRPRCKAPARPVFRQLLTACRRGRERQFG